MGGIEGGKANGTVVWVVWIRGWVDPQVDSGMPPKMTPKDDAGPCGMLLLFTNLVLGVDGTDEAGGLLLTHWHPGRLIVVAEMDRDLPAATRPPRLPRHGGSRLVLFCAFATS